MIEARLKLTYPDLAQNEKPPAYCSMACQTPGTRMFALATPEPAFANFGDPR